LIVIDVEGDAAHPVGPSPGTAVAPAAAPASHASNQPAKTGNGAATGEAVLATPATRKLARDIGVDIRGVTGSGRAGRVTSDDVRAHGEGSAPAVPVPRTQTDGVRIPFRGLRKKIAETLVRSKQTAPHVTYVEEIDCTALVALRAKLNARGGDKLSFLPFIIKATIAALKKFPQMNAMLDEAGGPADLPGSAP
jgi:pyruvate dehydrogenase E2 component (dihydrolipoamide acetyltransferase)